MGWRSGTKNRRKEKGMKLMFICGTLEPGCDGVGDYVRRLSAALLKAGHTVNAIALNDQYQSETSYESQDAEGTVLTVLRLPSRMRSAHRNSLASAYIEEKDPDKISLQFVPYSFHKKGIPLLLGKNLQMLIKNRGVHILFHEIWLDSPVGLRQKITAAAQRLLICRLVAILKPEFIHVSVPFEKMQLEQVNINSEVLNLFGNIYPGDKLNLKDGISARQIAGIGSSVLYFGVPPRGMFRAIFFRKLIEFLQRYEQGIRLILACGESDTKDEFCSSLRKILKGYNCEIVDCGFLAAGELSTLMSQCQAGISKSKPHLLGKSGAAIAMLEHGLPIWMPRWDGKEQLSGDFRKQLIFPELDHAICSEKLGYQPLIGEVVEQFTKTLQRS
jgi:hypothetical protein